MKFEFIPVGSNLINISIFISPVLKKNSAIHLSIILIINKLIHKILFYNKFIIFIYMFRAMCALHQDVKLYYTASGIITPGGGPSGAHSSLNLCTGRSPTGVTIPDAV